MGDDKVRELIEEKKRKDEWRITDIKIDLRRSDVSFCATPDGEGYELTVVYTPTDRPRKPHDNSVCFQLSAGQFALLLEELKRGLERRREKC